MVATVALRALAIVSLGVVACAGSVYADAEQQRRDEQDMLERARQEAPMPRPKRLDVTVGPSPTAPGPQPDAGRASLEGERTAELDRLSDKLRRAAAQRPNRVAAPDATTSPWSVEVVTAPPERAPAPNDTTQRSSLGRLDHGSLPAKAPAAGRVTILMVMQVGDRGIRRTVKTADPILCSDGGCWVSTGDGSPAHFLAGRKPFGVINTLGPRAGACREQTACVFRDIDLGDAPATVRPVDLRLFKHDRRDAAAVTGDRSCRVTRDKLVCAEPVRGPDYVMWIVPETIADLAGPDLLRRAVASGLTTN
jgi:colicin import membrane protein